VKNYILAKLKQVKDSSHDLTMLSEDMRCDLLEDLASELTRSAAELITENNKDLAAMDKSDPKYDRLLLNDERIKSIARDIRNVAAITHPSGRIIEEKMLENGLKLKKISVPLGVVAVIYESRPNVTLDVFALCFKSGNACVLKGGKEAFYTNQFLVSMIQKILNQHYLDLNTIFLMPPEREAMDVLLSARQFIDVCIPRGSQSLINYVREHAKIPIIETGAGIVHTYFDLSGNKDKGALIINNAKTRRVSVCNALDTLIIHQDRLADLFDLVKPLIKNKVIIYADNLSFNSLQPFYPSDLLEHAHPHHFGQEYLDYKLAIKTVSSLAQAVEHITTYTSGHSEAIITEDPASIDYFLERVDAAALYINASTAFTDGGQFAMGAEIGISTQKLHARGPMSLDALTSYKWIVFGDGHIR
jgi:glutamate-5-semialdehyde dehydrogenase